jgi:hypothetical protein
MRFREELTIAFGTIIIVTSSVFATACNTAADIADLQDAIDTYVQNKSLAEQFVRDLKTSLSPSDPALPQIMQSYYDARDSYNHFLDEAEAAAKNRSHSNLSEAVQDAEDNSTQFLEAATRALRPTLNTRSISFARGIVIPTSLPKDLNRLSPKLRDRAIDKLDHQIRWRSWRDL